MGKSTIKKKANRVTNIDLVVDYLTIKDDEPNRKIISDVVEKMLVKHGHKKVT